ncbi:MAG: 1-deoxy-D-xylulose-5-phosphate synthase [Clostridia bacterium]|nr:1-deoxy-D-xylulose-5-phosphate synthase [Clostridia bacterium]
MLEKINKTEDLKQLNKEEKKQLAQEIRKYIIETVAKNGGHLASNLGVVDLTIALHSIYNVPEDKIVWDVGHQTYTHKILTGRKEEFKTIRTREGIAGFPKTCEAEEDCFNTGHSSTSISAALGMAKARDIKNETNSVIAIIGDGALTGGMALEALNDAGNSKTKFTVILNDNEMSISRNVGGVNRLLTRLRTKKLYTKSNISIKKIISKIPIIGKTTVKLIQRTKRSIKQFVIPKMYFEDIGFTYLGPVDGHNIEQLENILRDSKKLQGPVLIHVLTKKGKGYKPAEENPDKFHATGSFDIETGKATKEKSKDYSKVFGDKLVEIAQKNNKIVAITAAMKDGTGLTEFSQKFPERFFDVGIAEQHALGFGAGLAKSGMIPIIPIYSSFYQRAYDQAIHDICLQNLHVIMCVDRAGLVGADGETHHGIFDLSFFKIIPNIVILAPKDFQELEKMLEFAVKLERPVVIRYPRGGEKNSELNSNTSIELGKCEILQEGNDVTIIGIGKTVASAIELSNHLKEENINAEVINARFLKPFDKNTILESIIKTKKVITMEDNTVVGGLATEVKELIAENNEHSIEVKSYGVNDKFMGYATWEDIFEDVKNIEYEKIHLKV